MARISDLLAMKRTVSFEIFPPKTMKGAVSLAAALRELDAFSPDFLSVTYGAGGSDRERTVETIKTLGRKRPAAAMAHLTCLGHTEAEVRALLDQYADLGVRNILALGGDEPADGSPVPQGDFQFASDLVDLLVDDGRFGIGVAAHPEVHPRSSDRAADRRYLAQKLDKADFAITQFFFDIDHYRGLVADLAELGCTKPIIPGVIPITNGAQVQRFAQMAGATVPQDLIEQIAQKGDDAEAVSDLGVAVAVKLCQELLAEGAPGLHLYTLNRAEPTMRILQKLLASAPGS